MSVALGAQFTGVAEEELREKRELRAGRTASVVPGTRDLALNGREQWGRHGGERN